MNPQFENVGDIITRTIEECSELIHILCKAQRFGWHSYHPDDATKTQNYVLVRREVADVKKRLSQLEAEIEQITKSNTDDDVMRHLLSIDVDHIPDHELATKCRTIIKQYCHKINSNLTQSGPWVILNKARKAIPENSLEIVRQYINSIGGFYRPGIFNAEYRALIDHCDTLNVPFETAVEALHADEMIKDLKL